MAGQLDLVELFFSSAGRLARGPFLIAAAVLFALAAVYQSLWTTLHWLTGWVIYPLLIFCAACVLSKRLHDRGRNGWLSLLVIVALIGLWSAGSHFLDFLFALVLIWAVVELAVLPGEQGSNRYGPNPLKPVAA